MRMRRLAAHLVKQHGYGTVAGLVPLLMKRLIEQAGQEKPGIAVEDLSGGNNAAGCTAGLYGAC